MQDQTGISLSLGILMFSFVITSLLIVPFIDLLYKYKLIRKKEAPKSGKVPLFDKLHDIKAGTPVGGGILIIAVVSSIFLFLFPLASRMGVVITSTFNFRDEVALLLFTMISFGLLGLSDDLIKIFGKPKKGNLGMWVGLGRRQKFIIQWGLALVVGFILHERLGIQSIHIPLIGSNISLGLLYVPFAAFVIVTFTNAFNITDGLDGLACGLLVICLSAFAMIASSSLDGPLSLFIMIWVGALIAYLYFNVWPARIILGDTGAQAFGAVLAVVGLLTGAIVALLLIGGIFIIELISSAIQIISWKYFKKPIFALAPIHHSFLAKGWEEPKIVMRAWLAGGVLAIFGLWVATI